RDGGAGQMEPEPVTGRLPQQSRLANRPAMESEIMPQRFDIAIAGRSLAGLALARPLGLSPGPEARIPLLERRLPVSAAMPSGSDPRAFALSAGSRRLLEAIEIWSAVADAACPVTRIDITDSSLDHVVRPVLLSYDNILGDGQPASHI